MHSGVEPLKITGPFKITFTGSDFKEQPQSFQPIDGLAIARQAADAFSAEHRGLIVRIRDVHGLEVYRVESFPENVIPLPGIVPQGEFING